MCRVFFVSVAALVVIACSSSKDAPARPDASADAAEIPDRPVNVVVDAGSCPDPYPKPGPEILTRTPALDRGVEAIYRIRPDLKYIARLKHEYPGGDGPRILPFLVDGGFDVVMINGTGDCQSVCTTFEYWYFEVRDLHAESRQRRGHAGDDELRFRRGQQRNDPGRRDRGMRDRHDFHAQRAVISRTALRR